MKADIERQVKELLAPGDYRVYDSQQIPGPGDSRLTFGNTGVRFRAIVLFMDMRGSTRILNAHRPHSVAKIHKAYLYVATKLTAHFGGQIRSYNGDSILAFFPGDDKTSVEKAVMCAMKIKYLLTQVCSGEFDRYSGLDFGIGLDCGQILCVKAGLGRNDNHNDLLWLGNAVNRATVLSDQGKANAHVWISADVRKLLTDRVKLGSKGRGDMWKKKSIVYDCKEEPAWATTWHWEVA